MSTSARVRKVVVVIVTYNGAEWISNCLLSLSNSTYPVDVIVVDNHSTDQTVDIVKTGFPNVVLILNTANQGFGNANNAGIKRALAMQADFVFLLNQDTTVEPEAIERLIYAAQESGFAVLSPVHLTDDGETCDRGFVNFVKEDLGEENSERLATDAILAVRKVSFVNAAAWMIPANTFSIIGGFAPMFFHYGEDRDFVNRMRYHHMDIAVVASARIVHYRGRRNSDVQSWQTERQKKYYFVGWLSRAADINKSLLSAWTNGLVWSLKEMLVALVSGRMKSIIIFCSVLVRMTGMIGEIAAHRSAVKENKPYMFLQ